MKLFTTYMVQNKADGTFSMCSDVASMEMHCRELQSKRIGYKVEKHEVDLAAFVSGNANPKVTLVKEWDPE